MKEQICLIMYLLASCVSYSMKQQVWEFYSEVILFASKGWAVIMLSGLGLACCAASLLAHNEESQHCTWQPLLTTHTHTVQYHHLKLRTAVTGKQ